MLGLLTFLLVRFLQMLTFPDSNHIQENTFLGTTRRRLPMFQSTSVPKDAVISCSPGTTTDALVLITTQNDASAISVTRTLKRSS